MTWTTTFGTLLGGDQPLSLFDGMFNQTAAMIQIPCSASGNNAVSLTPLINCPALAAYNELGGYRFRANGNSSAAVTAQFNGLGFLPVYHADGVTQANIGDLVSGQEYVLIYSATLSGGFPGFFLEQPAVGGGSVGLGGTPGGRLTVQSGVPVMSSTQGSQIIYYAPYVNQFVPIWDGSTLQQYNFCSSLSDQVGLSFNMAGSSTFPINTSYDVFVTINGGLPILALVAWTNPGPSPAPLRATALSIFGGMLTNATTATMRISVAGTLSVPANQATFLGTIGTSPSITGFCPFQYGAAAVGGSPAYFGLCNYYNKCLFNTIVQDSGVPYTYTPATVRQARASAGNQISYIQSDSERAATFSYNAPVSTVAALGAFTVTGIGTQTTSFQVFTLFQAGSASVLNSNSTTVYQLSNTGLANIVALEQGDGTYANTFGQSSLLGGSIWL